MTNNILNDQQFIEYFSVRSWLAVSHTGKGVHSAIVNIKDWQDRRRNRKVYIYYDYKLDAYVTEKAT